MIGQTDKFDVKYVKGLVDDLSATSKKHGDILVELKGIAIETQTLIKGQAETQKAQGKKLDEQSVRLRAVERAHDSCKADTEIRGIKKQLNRFMAFKDMI